jgi:hypothetical protein
MALCHIVTFTFKPDTPTEAITELSSALDDLANRSKAISYRHGRDLGLRDGNADYAVTAVFRDADQYAAYMTSPEHRRVVHDLVAPHLECRSAAQFSITDADLLRC